MRARFMHEKFVEDSDPIADLNIGMMQQIKLWMKSIDELFENKDQALWFCSQHGKLNFVEYLLDAGADVHTCDDDALQLASVNGHTEVVKLLLGAGADVHAHGDAALQWASMHGHTEVVKLLLNAGVNIHVDNDCALRWASYHGHTEVVKILKDHIAKEKKVVKENLNEKFIEDSDPIADMGIGKKALIKQWINKCNKNPISYHGLPLPVFIINNDSTIDLPEGCHLPDDCGNIPDYIQFRNCMNNFSVDNCGLTSFKGLPTYIEGSFFCAGNNIESLKFIPKHIIGSFDFRNNGKKFTEKQIRRYSKITEKVLY